MNFLKGLSWQSTIVAGGLVALAIYAIKSGFISPGLFQIIVYALIAALILGDRLSEWTGGIISAASWVIFVLALFLAFYFLTGQFASHALAFYSPRVMLAFALVTLVFAVPIKTRPIMGILAAFALVQLLVCYFYDQQVKSELVRLTYKDGQCYSIPMPVVVDGGDYEMTVIGGMDAGGKKKGKKFSIHYPSYGRPTDLIPGLGGVWYGQPFIFIKSLNQKMKIERINTAKEVPSRMRRLIDYSGELSMFTTQVTLPAGVVEFGHFGFGNTNVPIKVNDGEVIIQLKRVGESPTMTEFVQNKGKSVLNCFTKDNLLAAKDGIVDFWKSDDGIEKTQTVRDRIQFSATWEGTSVQPSMVDIGQVQYGTTLQLSNWRGVPADSVVACVGYHKFGKLVTEYYRFVDSTATLKAQGFLVIVAYFPHESEASCSLKKVF